MVIHGGNESEDVASDAGLDILGWLLELLTHPLDVLFNVRDFFYEGRGSFKDYLRARRAATILLESSLALARMWPQYVVLNDYFVCLVYYTFWRQNYPYAYGDVAFGEWVAPYKRDGKVLFDGYFKPKNGKPSECYPSFKARKALRKFIREHSKK